MQPLQLPEKVTSVRLSDLGGKCLVAKRNFQQGELMFIEKSLVCLPVTPLHELSPDDKELIQGMMKELYNLDWPYRNHDYSDATAVQIRDRLRICEAITKFADSKEREELNLLKGELLKLAQFNPVSTSPLSNLPIMQMADAIATNAFVDDDGGTWKVFPIISRAQHCCKDANTAQFSEGRPCEMLCKALRPIKAGEEITIRYYNKVASMESVDERRAYIQRQGGFLCECKNCK